MVKKVDLASNKYPKLLKKLTNAPENLWYIGQESLFSAKKTIAIIGSRQMTQYGRDVTYDLTGRLIQSGFVIVSGLASGIDQTAHEIACLLSGGTIGVLGYGFSHLKKGAGEYETARRLFLSENGLVVSPYKNSQKPEKHTFINRNKIIAGLSMGVIVIEAVAKSGTFHTVEASIELGREVFAVPGSVFSQNSKGTHYLIKSGATLVDDLSDILANFDKDPI